MKLPKQRTEQEVIVHVQDEGQELVLMEEGRMGEHQNQVVVEEKKEKGEGLQPVVIRQEHEEMGKPSEAQVPPLPLPATAIPPQQEHAQEHQQQSEPQPSLPCAVEQGKREEQRKEETMEYEAPPPPPPLPPLPEISLPVDDGGFRGDQVKEI